MPRKICLVGIGKIAVDQHVPSIKASADWELAATVSRAGTVDGVQAYTDFDLMLDERSDIDTISLCLPPVPRYDYAARAIAAGRHVMLEKPPGATLSEVAALEAMAKAACVTIYTTWHSRMAEGVAPAKAWLEDKKVTSAHINWKEDVRRWHPGQDWVFDPGGMGVFDPGINALSIMTEILPIPVHLRSADLLFPANRDTPIAAHLTWTEGVTGDFDWRQEGPQSWDITVETNGGTLNLHDGGARLVIDGAEVIAGPGAEYPALYARMAELVAGGASEVDVRPMLHVADAMTLGKRVEVDAFDW
ncbi:Gfo/Idh/MocA family protein [Yoonia litorea]|uniref:D-galactose 1-dehydrogenase n=1 Tax=Yoonia litorea TaxID=1123755 RepID=A0A1I6MV19_9RHOB|nr:Gfo/Idh/MocA family oxidoreductase [Yoonia litorea]SFS19477.1 D-galactose 1-dehydrogenase [Yoonia litorea]